MFFVTANNSVNYKWPAHLSNTTLRINIHDMMGSMNPAAAAAMNYPTVTTYTCIP